MAYPIIKSVWDNFTESYMKAREARAREERAKELSMREFDANQRAWNEDDRVGDQYTNYISPANQYALRGLGRADELGIANQGGNLAVANSNTDILRGLYTPENTAREITRVNSDRDVMARMAAGRSALPSGVLYSAAQAPYYAGAVGGVNAQSDLAWLNSPEYQAYKNQTRKDSVTLGRINNEYNIGIANSQLTEMQNAENKSTTEKETARLLSRYPAPTIAAQLPTTTVAEQAPSVTTPAAQTPMASMAARQPSGNIPTYEGWIAAKQAKEQIIANSEKMNPSYRDLYLSSRLPELDKAIVFNSNYARY